MRLTWSKGERAAGSPWERTMGLHFPPLIRWHADTSPVGGRVSKKSLPERTKGRAGGTQKGREGRKRRMRSILGLVPRNQTALSIHVLLSSPSQALPPWEPTTPRRMESKHHQETNRGEGGAKGDRACRDMVCFVRLTLQPSSPPGELSSEWGSDRARQRLNVFSDLVSEVLWCHLVTCESLGQPRFKRGMDSPSRQGHSKVPSEKGCLR